MAKKKQPPASLSILDALGDPALFGAAFTPADSWRAWQTFLAVLDGVPLATEAERELARRCTGRQLLPTTPAREAWVVCGRRSGKSRIASLIAVYGAAFVNWKARTAPGETAVVAVLAADKAQARVIHNYCRGLIEQSPLLRTQVVGDKTDALVFTTGAAIEVHASDFKSLRGRSFALCLADEVCFWEASAESANPDKEVVRAVRPGLATLGGRLIGISSPYAQRGILYEQYRKHYGQDASTTLVWQADSRTMNPGLSAELIAEAFAEDPDAARAEWAGFFRADLSDLFSPESLAACTAQGRTELPPSWTAKHVGGLDAAGGGGQDSLGFALCHRQGGRVVVDVVREYRPPFDPLQVVADVATLAKAYGCRSLVADKWGGGFVVEAFAREGVAVEHSDLTTSDTFLELAPLINGQLVELLDHPRLLRQLGELQRSTGRGRDHVEHRRGDHDDVAAAAAGAVVRAAVGLRGVRRRLGVGFSSEKPTVEHVETTPVPAKRASPERAIGILSKQF